ncbi:hypothetical protein RV18_GL003252 [Enterococcus termitis]|nr:hypothetical protein RV18_GL003252 [Enterococcus termitis]
MAFGFLIVLGSTYAWVTLADERVNQMATGRLEIVLEGRKDMDVLAPKVSSQKDLAVRNNSTVNAVVRVSLKEVLLTFEVDTTDKSGNGALKVTNQAVGMIDVGNSSTWETGKTLERSDGTYQIGDQRATYVINSANARPALLENAVVMNFNSHLTDQTPPPAGLQQNYWLYYEGYFYYSEVLRPGETTNNLVDSINVTEKAANKMKGSFYELSGKAEGYSAAKVSISSGNGFNLGTSNPVYQMLESKVK